MQAFDWELKWKEKREAPDRITTSPAPKPACKQITPIRAQIDQVTRDLSGGKK